MISDDLKAFMKKYEFDKDFTIEKRAGRAAHIQEELDEYKEAVTAGDEIGMIDALVDIVYLAVGQMVLEGWDFESHFAAVHGANIDKVRGFNPRRPHMGDFDVYKPEGWMAPESRHALILLAQEAEHEVAA